ncbi:hypothetical protein [Bradyrhizobium prioriisuperbiae]|uniref:hypothetical protein n=1 Tax=Bradyrhizobium prioriisuperbiae TaxID=2854389 RepID=UPI0028E7DA98|nr:hypothetical protein [Bradyrhizobium prioritasuperba]
MTTHDLLTALFSWWPFVMLIGAYLLATRFLRPRSTTEIVELYKQQIAETRRTNDVLERIAATLEKRSLENSAS